MEPQRNVTCSSVAYTTEIKIINFQGDLTDISAKKEALVPALHQMMLPSSAVLCTQQNNAWLERSPTVLLFSNLNEIFFGYFDPENIYLDNKNNHFSG